MPYADPERNREARRRWAARNPEKIRAAQRAHRLRNLDKAAKQVKDWRSANPERAKEISRASYARNCEARRDAERARSRANYQANRAYYIEKGRARSQGVSRATPSWVDREDIRYVYDMAALFKVDVDHVYPLKGKNSCGLHVPWNLQLLPRKDNLAKGNKMPNEVQV